MAVTDIIRRPLGLATDRERHDAQRALRGISLRGTSESRLALEVADLTVGRTPGERRPLPDGLVRIMLPEIGNDARPLPRDHDMRRHMVAEAVLKTVGRHLEQGSDEALGRELGRALRLDVVRNTPASNLTRTPLDKELEERTRRQGREVASFLAYGDKVESHHTALVRALPRRGEVAKTVERLRRNVPGARDRVPAGGQDLATWVDRAMRTERAMARSGVLPADQVVRAAHAVMRDADTATLSCEPRARPDFEAARTLDAAARRQAVLQWMATPDRRTPTAAQDAITEGPASMPSPALRAAFLTEPVRGV